MKEETVGLDYEYEYNKLLSRMSYENEERELKHKAQLDKLYEDLIKYEKEIEFYKNIIKSILHIK